MDDALQPSLEALLAERDWVRSLAGRLVRDAHEADDLAQAALAAGWARPPRDAARVRAWLARVLRNLVHQERRRRREHEAAVDGEQGAAPSSGEVVERAEVHRHVVHAVLELSEPYRTTVLLRYFEGLGPAEIARRDAVPLATVTSRLTRAHARLRERMQGLAHGERVGLAILVPLLSVPKAPSAAAPLFVMSVQLKLAALAALAVVAFVTLREDPEPPPLTPAALARAQAPVAHGPAAVDSGAAREVVPGGAGSPALQPADRVEPALRGRVLRPDGTPAPTATVALGGVDAFLYMELDEDPPGELVRVDVEEDGSFALVEAPAEDLLVCAGAPNAAPSEPLRVDCSDGRPRDDLVLVLRRGARVQGEVLRRDGSFATGRKVRFLQETAHDPLSGRRLMRWVETDDQGRFDARHLCPGGWGIVSYPDDEELALLGGTMPEHMVQATVELDEGQEEFVVLGAPSSAAVIVTGRVTLAGEGVEGCMMQWIGECEDPMASQRTGPIDGDGRYEVELPTPGAWYMRVMGSGGHGEFHVDVPATDAHRIDFALPAARIEGRVVDAEGQPVRGALLSHVLLEGGAPRGPLRIADDRDTTGGDGVFVLAGLSPGTYSIGATHSESGVAVAVQDSVVVDEVRTGVELVLVGERSIEGRLLGADGRPAGRVPLWLHDAAGRILNPITTTLSGADGTFRTPPLSPGEYSILAQVGKSCAFAAGVRVGDAPHEPLELELVQGATLVVEVRVEDEVVRAQVRVRDQDGRLHTGLRNMFDPWSWRRYPLDTRRVHLGPFSPATYNVEAHVPGVGTKVLEVTTAASETLEVGFTF